MQEKTIKILVGITKDNQIVYANLSLRDNYFSVTHDTLRELITEEEGEERAEEYLKDGELWKRAVDADQTTSSLENWIDDVLSIDGWETTVDAEYFGNYNDIPYYSTFDSCGASVEDFKKEYSFLIIPQEDLNLITESDKLHIKDFKQYTKEDKQLLKQIKDLMNKYDTINDNESLIIEKWLKNKE